MRPNTAPRGFDVGAGRGKPRTARVESGGVGLVIDTRGRLIALPPEEGARVKKMNEWLRGMGLAAL